MNNVMQRGKNVTTNTFSFLSSMIKNVNIPDFSTGKRGMKKERDNLIRGVGL